MEHHMQKLDLKKAYKSLYRPSAKEVSLVEVPQLNFLMIDGQIEKDHEPGNSPAFQEATAAMYGAAYTLKFMSKLDKNNPIDYGVMALEGLWWVEDGQFDIKIKDNWFWTLMILQPEHITQAMFQAALVKLKKKEASAALPRLRLVSFQEGLCVQIMHIGPYAAEPQTVNRLENYANEHNLKFNYKHHEIYLGDPRRAKPEELKTILRHPVESILSPIQVQE
jgi:hypothetical protein